MTHRQKLVELRDYYRDEASSTADDDYQLGMYQAFDRFADALDAILADWDDEAKVQINLPIIDEDMWEQLSETDLMTWNRHRGGPEWTQTAVDFVAELQRARSDTNPHPEGER